MNPKVRFKNNDGSSFGDYSSVAIGSLFSKIKAGGTPKSSCKEYYNGDIKFLSISDMTRTGKYVEKTEKNITEDGISNSSAWIVPKGSVLLSMYASYGKVCINNDEMATSQAILAMVPENNNAEYLYQLLCYLDESGFWDSYVKSGTQPNLSKGVVEKVRVFVPELGEQQKIATFFRTLDAKIYIVRKKLTCLQKINNRLVGDVMSGKIRFLMENGKSYPDWKCEKLGKSFSVKMCKRIFKDETLDVGDVPFYKIGTFGGEPDSYITQEQFELYKTKYSYPSTGDTLISCSGTVGRCVVFDGSPSYFQDSNIVWLESKESNFVYDKEYLTAVLKNLTWNELSSSTIKRIYSKDLLEKEWFVPCMEEQQAISKFIFELNDRVALENKKLSSLIKLKKSFMQQMFV